MARVFPTDMFTAQISRSVVRFFSRLLDFIESKFDFSFEIKKLLNPFDTTAFLKGSCEFSLL